MVKYQDLEQVVKSTTDAGQRVTLIWHDSKNGDPLQRHCESIHIRPWGLIEFHDGPVCPDAQRIVGSVCWCKE